MNVPLGPKTHLVFLTLLEIIIYADKSFLNAAQALLKNENIVTKDDNSGILATLFVVGFMLASPIFTAMGRRSPRASIYSIIVGMLLWMSSMILSFFLSNSLVWLCVMRFLAGAGQASFISFAPAIIDKASPLGSASLYMGIYFMAIYIGSALGFVLGGMFTSWGSARYMYLGWAVLALPFVSFFYINRDRFLVPTYQTVSNTSSTASTANDSESVLPSKMAMLKRIISTHSFMLLAVGYGAFIFYVGGLAFWAPVMVQNIYPGWTSSSAAFMFGAITAATGIVGTITGGCIVAKVDAKYAGSEKPRAKGCSVDGLRCHLSSRISFWMILAALPLVLTLPWVGNAYAFFALVGFAELLMFASTAPVNIAIMAAVPEELKSTAMGVSALFSHALGDVPSPYLIGFFRKPSFWGITQEDVANQRALFICALPLIVTTLFWLAASKTARIQGRKDFDKNAEKLEHKIDDPIAV